MKGLEDTFAMHKGNYAKSVWKSGIWRPEQGGSGRRKTGHGQKADSAPSLRVLSDFVWKTHPPTTIAIWNEKASDYFKLGMSRKKKKYNVHGCKGGNWPLYSHNSSDGAEERFEQLRWSLEPDHKNQNSGEPLKTFGWRKMEWRL